MADRYVELTGTFEPGVKYECYPQGDYAKLQAENAKLKEVLHKMLDNSILWLPTVEACYENPDEARALLALECIIKKALKEKPC